MLRINTPPRTDAIWLLCVKEIPEPRPSWEQSAVDFLEMLVKIVRIQTCVLVHQFERVCIKRQIETAANMHSHFHTVDGILEHLLWDTLRNAARTSVTLKSNIYHGHETPGPTRRSGCSGFTGTVDSDYSCAFGAETARPAILFSDKAATCLSKTSRERCFVNASAGFALLWTLNSRKSPRRRPSWTHKCPTAR